MIHRLLCLTGLVLLVQASHAEDVFSVNSDRMEIVVQSSGYTPPLIASRANETKTRIGALNYGIGWTGLSGPSGVTRTSCTVSIYSGDQTQTLTGDGSCSYNPGFCGPVNYQVTATFSTLGGLPTLHMANVSGLQTCVGQGWTFTLPANNVLDFSFNIGTGGIQPRSGGYTYTDDGVSRVNTEFSASFSPAGTTSALKYPVILVHGLDSSHATWVTYGNWQSKGDSYGGTLVAIDRLHATTTGNYSNTNLPQGSSSPGCPTNRDVTQLYDVRFYFGCDRAGGYFTMSFSNKNDLSFAAQALELRAIVDAVTALTGKSKVFLVGHSMGGLASRAYVQYLGGGSKVAGVISVGTPHQGALAFIGNVVSFGTADVKAMLAAGSLDLNMLNDLNTNPWPSSVNTYAIALDQGGSTAGDNVVGVTSQRNNYSWAGITVPPFNSYFVGIGHMSETNDERIRGLVHSKLVEWSRSVP